MENEYILIVDDEERMRKLIKDFLKQKGYPTIEASDDTGPTTAGT